MKVGESMYVKKVGERRYAYYCCCDISSGSTGTCRGTNFAPFVRWRLSPARCQHWSDISIRKGGGGG